MLFSETTPAAQMQRLVMSHTGFPCRGLEQNLPQSAVFQTCNTSEQFAHRWRRW